MGMLKIGNQVQATVPDHYIPSKNMTTIKLAREGEIIGTMDVYNDTTVDWLFTYTVAMFQGDYNLLSGEGNVSLKQNSHLCFRKFGSDEPLVYSRPSIIENLDSIFFWESSGEKNIREVHVQNGDVLMICQAVVAAIDIYSKQVDNRSNVAADKRSKQKRTSNGRVSYLEQEPSLTYREMHSKSMGPVLDELRPQLKAIRDKLNSLSLKKNHPKVRIIDAVAKKSSFPIAAPPEMQLEGSLGGKACKTVYPILVGEASNLYNTSSVKLSKTRHTISLDLHGYSKAQAREMLHKGLKEWIVEAMRGEYQFVIPVNIICGGGNQVLSTLVAQFIRETSQVSNMPKCLCGCKSFSDCAIVHCAIVPRSQEMRLYFRSCQLCVCKKLLSEIACSINGLVETGKIVNISCPQAYEFTILCHNGVYQESRLGRGL